MAKHPYLNDCTRKLRDLADLAIVQLFSLFGINQSTKAGNCPTPACPLLLFSGIRYWSPPWVSSLGIGVRLPKRPAVPWLMPALKKSALAGPEFCGEGCPAPKEMPHRCRLQVNRRLAHFEVRFLQLNPRPTLLFAAKS